MLKLCILARLPDTSRSAAITESRNESVTRSVSELSQRAYYCTCVYEAIDIHVLL